MSPISRLSSAQGMNSLGGRTPALRMVPPDERLEAEHLPGFEVDQRLVLEEELGSSQRQPELALEPMAVLGVRLDARAGELDGSGSTHLGDVHGGVGLAQELALLVAILGAQGDADAGGDVKHVVVDDQRSGQLVEHLRRHERGVLGLGDLRQDHDELVATETSQCVLAPQTARQPAGHVDEHLVSHIVAEAVVDDLEIVEVEEQHGQRGGAAPGPNQRLLHAVGEEKSVGEPGQRVVVREVLETLLGLLPLGDVPEHEQVADVSSSSVVQVREHELEMPSFAVRTKLQLATGQGWAVGVRRLGAEQLVDPPADDR